MNNIMTTNYYARWLGKSHFSTKKKKHTFTTVCLSLIFMLSFSIQAQQTFPVEPGPFDVQEGSPVTVNINGSANAAGIPAGSYDSFEVTADWVSTNNAFASEADLTVITAAGNTEIDPPTSGGADSGGATALTFSGDFAGTYDPSVDGTLDIELNQSWGGSSADWSNVQVTIFEAPDCVEPDNFVASNIMMNSVDLAWDEEDPSSATDGYEWVVMASGDAPDTGNAVETGTEANGTLTTNITGLSSNTDYDAYVRSICDAANSEVSDWSAVASFSTLFQGASCDLALTSATVTPYGDNSQPINIDTAGLPDMPNVPSCEGFDSTEQGLWYEITTNNSNGFALNMVSGDGEVLEGAIYDACGGTELICFADGGSVDLSSEILVTGLDQNTTYFLQLYTESFDEGVFELAVTDLPNCPAPQNLNVTNITSDSASLNFDEETSASDGYEYVLFTDGTVPDDTTTPDGNVSDGTTTSIPLTGLDSSTEYDAYVRSVCDANAPDVSEWSSVVTFTTACDVFVPDYSEDFADMTFSEAPDCWDEADAGDPTTGPSGFGSGDWASDDYLNDTSNSNSARINLYNDNTNSWLLSPLFDLSADGYEVVFDIGITAFSGGDDSAMGSDDEVQFVYSDDGGATWNSLETWAQGSEPSNSGESITYDLSGITGTSVQFAFWATEGSVDDEEDYNIYVDNFEVRTPPTCYEPLNLTVSNVTDISAELNWDEEDPSTATDGYEWVVMASGDAPDTANAVETGTVANAVFTANASNLTAETDYDAYVRSVCDAANDEFSSWTAAESFSTGIAPSIVSVGNPASESYCYDSDAFKEWRFDSDDGSPLTVIFSAGSVEANSFAGGTFDDLIVYDGTDDTGAVLFNSDSDDINELEGLSFTAQSGSMYITLDSDFSNSCQDDPDIDTIEFDVYVQGDEPTASVQIIHNSADPAAASVDVYLNEALLPELTGVSFRQASAFLDAPAVVDITVDIVPAGDDLSNSVYTQTFNLAEDESYIVVADGVLDPTQFDDSVNTIDFGLEVFAGAQQSSTNAGETSLLVHHGSTDAPTVDVVNDADQSILVDDIAYPEFQGYLDLPTQDYVINVETADNSAVVQSYEAPLQTLGLTDSAVTVVASGFLDPSTNQNGAAFGLWVALPAGGDLVALPEAQNETAEVQLIHNSADPSAEIVDVYLDGTLVADDFEFRTSSDFIEVPAEQAINIDVAPQNSTDVSESIYNLNTTLTADETYVAVANGVLDPSQFDSSVNTIDFGIDVFAGAQQSSTNTGETSVLVHHGSTDAPTVDVVNNADDAVLVDDISYTEFDGYLDLPTQDYVINVEAADNSSVVASYAANLQSLGLADSAITVVASGFLDPSANQNGADFGLWAALPSAGPLVELAETIGTDAFTDSNFNYYPNPVEQRLNISSNGIVDDVQIFNMLGQEVIHVEPNTESPQINMSGLQSGAYMMKVSIDGASESFRVIKK